MIRSRVVAPAIVLVLFLSVTPWAQWPGNPDSNMVISDRRGEQTLPKVAVVSDGGCYISWYDHSSGNYDVYMQRLDGDGLLQWDENGLLINNHTQQSWLTDYDMTVDSEDHAILVVNDIRNGGDLDIYAYRMSPDGEFVWGEDGITISDNDGFEPDPRVTVTSDDNVVIAWQEDEVVHLRKLTSDGTDYWDPPIITLTSTYGMANPRIAPADNDAVILQAVVASGPNYWDPQYLYAYKFDADGAHQWGPDGIAVSTAGGIALWMDLEIASDGAGGMYSYWYDTRNSVHHAYVQHIESDGTVSWTVNGVTLSTAANELQMYPSLVRLPGTEDVLVFYSATDPNQNNYGVHGQRLNSAGERQWGDGGIALVPIGNLVRWAIHGLQQEDGAIVTYFEDIDAVNSLVKAIRVDGDGVQVWGTSPVTMATTISDKGHCAADVNNIGQVIDVWYDDRIDYDNDIYLQNVNPDGSFGAYSVTAVSIEMIPDNPPVVVPAGGSFTYTGILTNNTDEQQVTDVAVLLRIPAGHYYGPLMRYNNVRLNPGQTVSIAGITQNVPGYAPLGVYDYIAGCGDYPSRVVDTVSFQFTVTAPAAGGAGDWSLDGWFNEEIQPVDYILHANYPNPFNAMTSISFDLAAAGDVSLKVYNLSGQLVETLVDGNMDAGSHVVNWDASSYSSGVYFYKLTAGDKVFTKRMTLLK